MTRKQDSAKGRTTGEDLKKLLLEDQDLLKTIIKETLAAGAGSRDGRSAAGEQGRGTANRLGYQAGYYSRMLMTRVGHIELRLPQDRQGRFRTEVFERYQHSEKALLAGMLEMYVQGVSTRKVKTITEELCGHESVLRRLVGSCRSWTKSWSSLPKRRLEEPYPHVISGCSLREGP
jgi:putative transposase